MKDPLVLEKFQATWTGGMNSSNNYSNSYQPGSPRDHRQPSSKNFNQNTTSRVVKTRRRNIKLQKHHGPIGSFDPETQTLLNHSFKRHRNNNYSSSMRAKTPSVLNASPNTASIKVKIQYNNQTPSVVHHNNITNGLVMEPTHVEPLRNITSGP